MKRLPAGATWRVWRGPQPGRVRLTIDTADYTLSDREALELANQLTDATERTR